MEVASFRRLIDSGARTIVASVDPGLNTAGYCIAVFNNAKPEYLISGSVSSIIMESEHKSNSVGLSLQKARQVSLDIARRVLSSGAKILVMETPPQHFAGNMQTKMKKAQDARLLFGMATMLYGILLAANSEFSIVTVEPSQWQPGFTRGNTKEWSVGFSSSICSVNIPDDHAADSISMLHIVSGAYERTKIGE